MNVQVIEIDVPFFIQDVDFLTLNDSQAFADSALSSETTATKRIFEALYLL